MQQDIQTSNHPISDDQVSSYLRSHPHFFEKHASLLTEIYLPSPHGNGAISLAERQQLAQRDKVRMLEIKLADLIEFAEENDATSKKVHDFSVNLLAQQNLLDVKNLITKTMQQDFAVTESSVQIWLKPIDDSLLNDEMFKAANEAFSDWVASLKAPYCGAKPEVTGELFAQFQSLAYIPLIKPFSKQAAFGVLVLGSNQTGRFKADMGTMYLERIGELVSAALLKSI